MVKKRLILGFLALMVIAGATFYACNKDKEFNPTQEGKLMGSTGIWECTVNNPIGTITVPDGQTPPCTKYFVNRFWNAAEQRYMGFSHTTEIHKCGTGTAAEVLTSVEFVAQINPDIPKADLDYSNVNHFILRVDDQDVVPGFAYVKNFTYTVIGADGEVIVKTGTIHITYESVLNVWNEINAQMEWGEDNDDGVCYGVCIQPGWRGCGSGSDKYCCGPGKACWLWHCAVPNNPFDLFKQDFDVFANVSLADVNDGNTNDGDGEDNRRSIILNFKYKYNTAVALNRLLNADNVLIIEEDMVEESGSYLQKLIGTTLPCTIPAGSYPATISTGTEGGITVILPVIY